MVQFADMKCQYSLVLVVGVMGCDVIVAVIIEPPFVLVAGAVLVGDTGSALVATMASGGQLDVSV